MKLLLDQNLSSRLIQSLEETFPDTTHVSKVGLERADDRIVWQYAKDEGFVIVSKDTDFLHLALLRGHPPKIIHLDIGNCSTDQILSLVLVSRDEIAAFAKDPAVSFLILRPD